MCAVPLLLCLGHHAQLSILEGDQFAFVRITRVKRTVHLMICLVAEASFHDQIRKGGSGKRN